MQNEGHMPRSGREEWTSAYFLLCAGKSYLMRQRALTVSGSTLFSLPYPSAHLLQYKVQRRASPSNFATYFFLLT
jgi:hypothetical protein